MSSQVKALECFSKFYFCVKEVSTFFDSTIGCNLNQSRIVATHTTGRIPVRLFHSRFEFVAARGLQKLADSLDVSKRYEVIINVDGFQWETLCMKPVPLCVYTDTWVVPLVAVEFIKGCPVFQVSEQLVKSYQVD